MLVKNHEFSFEELGCDLSYYFPEDHILFDIETTGFSSKTAGLYMIGCVVIKNGTLHLTQFLGQNRQEEEQLLQEFFLLCSTYTGCITFNGEGFDLPFLSEKAKKYGLENPLSAMTSLDLYKEMKPLQTILKLENLKQKTLEQFLGIRREDLFSGGELIKHYFAYEKSESRDEESKLLLHNYEDLLGLARLLPLQAYSNAFRGQYRFSKTRRTLSKDYYGNPMDNLLIEATLTDPVPKPISYSKGFYYLILNETSLKLNVQVKEDKIPVPYPDYKNYYYLEQEDLAVLKELAGSIDKKDRKPATVATAYGKFLLTEENMNSIEIFQAYLQQVLNLLIRWK